jgi:DNA-binding YbaB/EbfC family protein
MPDIKDMLGQVKQMQEQLQERVAQINVEASAGGGLVTVRMNGKKQLTGIEIDPAAVKEADREMLQDLVLSAVNDANRRVDEELQSQVTSMTGGINPFNIPGLF